MGKRNTFVNHAILERDRNPFGSPGLRLVQLYICLRTANRAFTLTRLAKMFACSRQTILRMVDQIQQLPDIEVETSIENRERTFRICNDPGRANVVLRPDVIRHLALCRDIVSHLLPQTLNDELRESLGAAYGERSTNDRPTPFAEPLAKGHIDYTPFASVIEDIQNAIATCRLCSLTYRPRTSSRDIQKLLVAPLHFIAYREAIYLRCRIYRAPKSATPERRTLAVHRILRFRVERWTFRETADDDRDPYFGFPYHKPVRVRVAFWNGAASYVAERTWSPDQKLIPRNDGALVLTLTTTSRLELISWVLSFGKDAELLSPKDMRDELAEHVRAVHARYEAHGAKNGN